MRRAHGAEEQDSLARSTEHLEEKSAELAERQPSPNLFGGRSLKIRAPCLFRMTVIGIVSHETRRALYFYQPLAPIFNPPGQPGYGDKWPS